MSLSERPGNNHTNRRNLATSSSSSSSSTDSDSELDSFKKYSNNHHHRRNQRNNDSRSQNQKNSNRRVSTSTTNGKKSESGIISSGIENPSYTTSYYDDEDDHGIGDCGGGGPSGGGSSGNRSGSGLPNGFITPQNDSKTITSNNNKPRHRTRKGKKFPPTPIPLPLPEYETPKRSRTANSSNVTSITPSGGVLSSPLNDMDLVDYEDYGSTTSDEERNSTRRGGRGSESLSRNELDTHFQPNYNNGNSSNSNSNNNSNSTKNSVATDYSKFNGGGGHGHNDTSGSFDGVHKDQRRASLYESLTSNIDIENEAPCSSSSIREGGAGGGSKIENSGILTSKNKILKKSASQNVSKSSLLGGNGGESDIEGGTRRDHYVFSGVGRHFGRKRGSSMNLTDESDGASESGAGGRMNSIMGREVYGVDLYGWKTRLKAISIVFLATLFILSASSLLFVFPIIIDPILLGLEAQFSTNPVQCRTTNLRNGTGPTECAVPSCREGCTADLFSCQFVDVEYSIDIPPVLATTHENVKNHEIITTISPNENRDGFQISNENEKDVETITKNAKNINDSTVESHLTQDNLRRGTLFININGCGYPPSVNCSEFWKSYGKLNTVFPCHYSQSNESVVVPNYSYSQQKRYLLIALSVPISLALFSALFLAFLMKCHRPFMRNRVVTKNNSSLKLIESAESSHSINNGINGIESNIDFGGGATGAKCKTHANNKLNGISKPSTLPQMNGTVPKANGHVFQDTMAGLMIMKSPEKISQSIQKLPHQHDSFDKSLPHLNGSVSNSNNLLISPSNQRKQQRYAKNKKLVRGQSIESNHFNSHDPDDKHGSEEHQM